MSTAQGFGYNDAYNAQRAPYNDEHKEPSSWRQRSAYNDEHKESSSQLQICAVVTVMSTKNLLNDECSLSSMQ